MERSRISVSGSSVVVHKKEGKFNLPIRNTQLVMLGNGTSITSEAMHLFSKERCHMAQSKGGLSVHTVFHSGLYANPARLCRQVSLANDSVHRLRIAKSIAIKKLSAFRVDSSEYVERIKIAPDHPTILGLEGAITKKEYKFLFGSNFERKRESTDLINKNISVLNSVLYSFITSVVCSLGYSPSIGFLHGHTRRGGLVFDMADTLKHKIYLQDIELLSSTKNMARELSDRLQANRNLLVKEIIKEIELSCGGADL